VDLRLNSMGDRPVTTCARPRKNICKTVRLSVSLSAVGFCTSVITVAKIVALVNSI